MAKRNLKSQSCKGSKFLTYYDIRSNLKKGKRVTNTAGSANTLAKAVKMANSFAEGKFRDNPQKGNVISVTITKKEVFANKCLRKDEVKIVGRHYASFTKSTLVKTIKGK